MAAYGPRRFGRQTGGPCLLELMFVVADERGEHAAEYRRGGRHMEDPGDRAVQKPQGGQPRDSVAQGSPDSQLQSQRRRLMPGTVAA